MCAGRGHHWQVAQFFQRVAHILRVADIDRISLQPFHGLRHLHAAQREAHHFLHIGDVEREARRRQTVDIDDHVTARGDALGIHRSRAGHVLNHRFDLLADLLNGGQIRPRDFNADRGFNAGGQHVDAVFDRHHPGVGQAGNLDALVQFLFQFLDGHAFAPLLTRLELNGGFDHGQWRRIGGSFRPADFAEHPLHFRHRHDQFVGLL